MNISHEKYLTDLYYGNTNKHSISRFEELFAHPNYKKIIQPELLKFMSENFQDEVILNSDNALKIMKKIDSFSFLSIHELSYKKPSVFFDLADCLSLKDDMFDSIKEWQIEDLSKDPYIKEDRTYAVNHPTLTSNIGLFKFNKTSQKLESLIKKIKILTSEKSDYVDAPQLSIPNVSQELGNHLSLKYKNSRLSNKF